MNEIAPDMNISQFQYRIGTVSRLTCIPPDTLRVWERRYSVVRPVRSTGGVRLYSRDDIRRLALLRQLVDAGHAIGTVAELSTEELQNRLRVDEAAPLSNTTGLSHACRVAVGGDALTGRVRAGEKELSGLDVVAFSHDLSDAAAKARVHNAEVLVLELPTVHPETGLEVLRMLRQSNAERLVVVYGFGSRRAIASLERPNVTTVRAPIGLAELRRACQRPSPPPVNSPVKAAAEAASGPTARRFTRAQLSQLAQLPTSVACECPHQLADLINSVTAFEEYSEQCENRSPDDASLHAYLKDAAGHARAHLEEGLSKVIAEEGLDVELD
ncbi:MAG: MerR family transcriptional regulator [Gammaproteobacteria bacterium]|nr:MerR family transcriptional regulator [Gammaproteobacteria bacterium]